MSAERIGYVRISTVEQNAGRQLEQLTNERLDKVFEDRVSGKSVDRPGLTKLMQHARSGDVVVVASMDRLARNLGDLRDLVKQMTTKGIVVNFLKEGLTFTDKADSGSMLMLNIMGAVAEFERELILERQREGIALAKSQGKYKGGKNKLTTAQIEQLRSRIAGGEKKSVLAREFGISRETLYTYVPVGSLA